MKNKQEILLIISGIILLAGLIWFVFYSMKFLISNVNSALEIGLTDDSKITRINFEGLKKIRIMK